LTWSPFVIAMHDSHRTSFEMLERSDKAGPSSNEVRRINDVVWTTAAVGVTIAASGLSSRRTSHLKHQKSARVFRLHESQSRALDSKSGTPVQKRRRYRPTMDDFADKTVASLLHFV
jgi:hypothetical protein